MQLTLAQWERVQGGGPALKLESHWILYPSGAARYAYGLTDKCAAPPADPLKRIDACLQYWRTLMELAQASFTKLKGLLTYEPVATDAKDQPQQWKWDRGVFGEPPPEARDGLLKLREVFLRAEAEVRFWESERTLLPEVQEAARRRAEAEAALAEDREYDRQERTKLGRISLVEGLADAPVPEQEESAPRQNRWAGIAEHLEEQVVQPVGAS